MSESEQPSKQDKLSEKQMIVQGLLFVFVLVPSVFFVFSIIISDYLAQTPPDRSFDDAARNSKALACESKKQNEGGELRDCWK
ncbi:hypothetical protein FD724_38675 (plasmid) [Nostoc sp. C057]|uniref:hypothetical protein n=1 Tax=Nostoc sp. C057 TaxID=2576903 RepID=UPI0015C378F8|nr:hypothetical protein [Nostoc sp. C057]QLE53770.1 hypothetical protein FD724_38675 [Nostoc sp. C057]